MQIAILSDIHGNGVAFDAVLNDLGARPADQIVCLGDAVQGGPQPAEVAQRLRELACPVVMGNADAWLLTGEETGHEQISDERRRKMGAIREWSLAQLSEADRAFIAAFRPMITLPLSANLKLLCFHGSPASFDDFIFPHTPEEEFQRMLGEYAADCIMTGGHVHLPYVRRIGGNFFFNPGSVGLAYNHQQPESGFRADACAEYAILTVDGGRISLDFRRVPVDVNQLAHVYRASGRPFAEDAIRQYTG